MRTQGPADMAELIALFPAIAFYGTVVVLAIAEVLRPGRNPTSALGRRWLTNIALFVTEQLVVRFAVPVSALALSQMAADHGVGLLRLVPLPYAVDVALGVLLLDLWHYIEHRLMHAVPLLWRLHRVHHSDVDVDFTTTERHHPAEVVLGAGGLMLAVYILGVPPLAIVVYIAVAGVVALLSHANLRLADGFDRPVRRLIVTPAVHVIHHSSESLETNSNFGTVLTTWDRLCGTYRAPTAAGDRTRVLGLEYFRDVRDARLDQVLVQPFLKTRTQPPTLADAGARKHAITP
jgi:sterol desaturase/sphingolipid hydroxylase (fatty acid hydroxylase superfamily)